MPDYGDYSGFGSYDEARDQANENKKRIERILKKRKGANFRSYRGSTSWTIADSDLRGIYGNPEVSRGRRIYREALTENRRIKEGLKPLGLGATKRTYKAYKSGKGNVNHVETFSTRQTRYSTRRAFGEITWKGGEYAGSQSKTGVRWETRSAGLIDRENREAGTYTSSAKIGELNMKTWPIHLALVVHQIEINTYNFVQIMTRYSKNVFLKSFDNQRFQNTGSEPWKPLSKTTIEIRRRRNISRNTILHERGKLRGSLKDYYTATPPFFTGTINTEDVPDRDGHMTCYAHFHNAPDGTYSYIIAGKPSIQRQFMGYSSYIDAYAVKIRNKYFLDDVFLFKGSR